MKVLAKLSALAAAVFVFASVAAVDAPTAMAASVQNPTANGVYSMTAVLHKVGTSQESHVNGILDPHVKLVKSDQGMTVSVLVPKDATAGYGANSDMVSDVAIESGDTFVSGTRTEHDYGTEYSGLPLGDASKASTLALGVEDAGPHRTSELGDYDTYMKADLVFTDCMNWWAGYMAQAPVDLPDGAYRIGITTKLADQNAEQTTFYSPTMGDNVFGSYIWLTVKAGVYTASLKTESVRGIYMDDFRYYRLAGDYTKNINASKQLRKASAVTLHRNDDGSLFRDSHGTYPDVISFTLPGAGADPYVFLKMRVFSSAMPFPEVVSGGVWTTLMDWNTLESVAKRDTQELSAKLPAAELLAGDAVAKRASVEDDWTAFENAFGVASDMLKAEYAFEQEQIDAALAGLESTMPAVKAAKEAADKKAAAELEGAIGNLPASEKASAADAAQLETAMKLKDALTPDQVALVSSDSLGKLEAVDRAVAADMAAGLVSTVGREGTAAYNASDRLAVNEALQKLRAAVFDPHADATQIRDAIKAVESAVASAKGNASKAAAAQAALAKASNINSKTVSAKQVRAAAALGATQVTLGPAVKKVAKGAFAGTKVKTVVVKSKKLTKKGVKGSLKGSKVKTVKVSVGGKKANKKFAKKYKGFFTKENCGLKGVKVK